MPAPPGLAVIDEELNRTVDEVLWKGTIALPADRRPGDFRVVIREFETWLDDDSVQEPAPALPPAPNRGRRLVYAEALEV